MLETDRQTGYPSIDRPWLKYYSDADLAIKAVKNTVYENIYSNNKEHLNDTALIYFGKKLSYQTLFENVENAVKTFSSMGVKKGDNVAFLMLTCPEMIYAILALNSIGAVANMVNPTFTAEQMRDRINDTEANIVIILDQLYERLVPVMGDICPTKKIIVPIENSMPRHIKMFAHGKLKKDIPYDTNTVVWNSVFKESKNKAASYTPITDYEENLPAIMVYSSGTTGASKGIVLTNHGINHTISYYDKEEYVITRGDVFLHMGAPWLSTLMVLCLLMPLKKGMSVAIEPVFSEESFVNGIKKYKPTLTLSTISHWLYVVEQLKDSNIDLSNMRYPITGGEKVLQDTEIMVNKFLADHNAPAKLLVGYGMCELGSTACSNTLLNSRRGAVGFPIKDVIVSAFDIQTNEECQYNQRGEIRVLTPARMKEYYKRPDATAEFFWKDAEGREWGCTGDVGYVDKDGFVYVEGRATDYFTTKSGDRVYNFDIENVILENEYVDQCEVVGRKNADGFEEPYAFVILSKGVDATMAISNIEGLCKIKLIREQVPIEIKVLESFPVKPSGKRNMEQLIKMASEE